MEELKGNHDCVHSFNENSFEEFPVWVFDGKRENKCPLRENYNPLPEDEYPLFIKAILVDGLGRQYQGYLVGGSTKDFVIDGGFSFYAFGLFVNGEDFILNLNLSKLIENDLKLIYGGHVEVPKLDDFFPVKYSSELYFEGEEPISGVFTIESLSSP